VSGRPATASAPKTLESLEKAAHEARLRLITKNAVTAFEELRRRLADPARPRQELDYLERLLRRY